MKKANKNKVFVMMSGGVDSSVAALLLKKRGYKVTGVFIRGYNVDGCQDKEAEDARRAVEYLNIPFYVFNLEKEYKKLVVGYMIDGYKKGITPNPDVMCNKEIKFGLFMKKVLELGANYVATGHYVKTKNGKLYAAKDENKDQSYFLWTLTQDQLKHCLFPIGYYLKSEVRAIAKKVGLPTAEKKDSQGICFLGKITLDEFLKQYIPSRSGVALTTEGKVLGEHQGAHFYTIGQRHIGLINRGFKRNERGLTRKPNFKPLYVAGKDIKANTLIVAEGDNHPALYKKEINLIKVNFISPITDYKLPVTVYVRVRYRQPLISAKLCKMQDTKYKILFDQPIKFVAPGQSAVFYSKMGELLGGGIIK